MTATEMAINATQEMTGTIVIAAFTPISTRRTRRIPRNNVRPLGSVITARSVPFFAVGGCAAGALGADTWWRILFTPRRREALTGGLRAFVRAFGVDDVTFVLRASCEFVFAEMLGFLGVLAVVGVHRFGWHHYLVQVSSVL